MYQSQTTVEAERYVELRFSDAHCHLNLFEDPEEAVKIAVGSGVGMLVTAGGSRNDNNDLLKYLHIGNVFGVIGISPDFLSEEDYIDEIKKIAKTNRKIVGIGEIGMDKKIAKNSEEIKKQEHVFRRQLDVARELGMPIVIHSRQAIEDVLKILGEYEVRAMFHFFEGGEIEAKAAEKRGHIISVPPVESSRRTKAIKAISIDSIVAETDSPVVGKTPADVKKSVGIIAEAKGLDYEAAAEKTTENLREFFYI